MRILVLLLSFSCSGPAPAASPPPRPNVVIVVADDLSAGEMEQLTDLAERFTKTGADFTHAYVNLPLCCPSRATMARGEYAHNTGILFNYPPSGGYRTFHEQGLEEDTLATRAHAAGYRTGWFGKYLNGYPDRFSATDVPPGWDDWVVPIEGDPYASYDYVLNDNGKRRKHGHDAEDHITDVIAAEATEFVRESAKKNGPFLAVVMPYAPHLPSDPPPRHADARPGVTAPRVPSFDEADVSDKGETWRAPPPMPPRVKARVDETYRKRIQAMLGVQDLVDGVLTALKDTGELDHTWVIFTSDNGFHQGEHRLPSGKGTLFEEDVRVPMYVIGPGVVHGQIDALVSNVDLFATVGEIAGFDASDRDGRSWLPWARGEAPSWRQGVLLERPVRDLPDEDARAVRSTLEPPEGENRSGAVTQVGVRSARWTYIRGEDGSRQLYDMASDPYQLENVAKTADPAHLAELDAWVDAMAACKGEACRTAEATPLR